MSVRLDRSTRLLTLLVIDDILNALELWQVVGETDARWVHDVWSRRITPRTALESPVSADVAASAGDVYATLLECQARLTEHPQ